MKRFILFIAGIAAALPVLVQCSKYDDSWIHDKFEQLDSKLTELENSINSLNSYKTILDKLNQGKLISEVTDNGNGTFTIKFSDNTSVTITAGKGRDGQDGKDGANGQNGAAGKDGKDGADGLTPEFKIENDTWYVRYGDGEWTALGSAVSSESSFFTNVSFDGDYLTFTLIDGTTISINLSTGEVFTENLAGKYFVYGGRKYNLVQLADGKWWMAEALAYVPEGRTVSSDPAQPAGIWYPYTISGSVCTPDITEDRGLLYDAATAFGLSGSDEITYADQTDWQTGNYRDFEGVRGICPPGWYVPTKDDYLKLVGVCTADQPKDIAAVNDPTALYYDDSFTGGGSSVVKFNAAGWNFSFLGYVNRATVAATGAYLATAVSATNCDVSEWHGLPSMNMIWTSSPYRPNTAGNNVQYFSLMSTFTTAYKVGRLSLGYGNYLAGMEVRCVRAE